MIVIAGMLVLIGRRVIRTAQRLGVVLTVDGLNVISGGA